MTLSTYIFAGLIGPLLALKLGVMALAVAIVAHTILRDKRNPATVGAKIRPESRFNIALRSQ